LLLALPQGNNLAARPLQEWEHGGAIEPTYPREVTVQQFIHQQNLEHYRRLLAAPDQNDDVRPEERQYSHCFGEPAGESPLRGVVP
jgi:hypothetical protein